MIYFHSITANLKTNHGNYVYYCAIKCTLMDSTTQNPYITNFYVNLMNNSSTHVFQFITILFCYSMIIFHSIVIVFNADAMLIISKFILITYLFMCKANLFHSSTYSSLLPVYSFYLNIIYSSHFIHSYAFTSLNSFLILMPIN